MQSKHEASQNKSLKTSKGEFNYTRKKKSRNLSYVSRLSPNWPNNLLKPHLIPVYKKKNL